MTSFNGRLLTACLYNKPETNVPNLLVHIYSCSAWHLPFRHVFDLFLTLKLEQATIEKRVDKKFGTSALAIHSFAIHIQTMLKLNPCKLIAEETFLEPTIPGWPD